MKTLRQFTKMTEKQKQEKKEEQNIALDNLSINLGNVISNPHRLDNEHLHIIGEAYYTAYPKEQCAKKWIDWQPHTNHPAADCLMNYEEVSEAAEKWQFLAQCFKDLKSSKGSLAATIIIIFEKAFKVKISIYQRETVEISSTSVVAKELQGISDTYFLKFYIQRDKETKRLSNLSSETAEINEFEGARNHFSGQV